MKRKKKKKALQQKETRLRNWETGKLGTEQIAALGLEIFKLLLEEMKQIVE